MIRTSLTYHVPTTIEEACRIVRSADGAVILGGGTIAVPQMVRGERVATDAVHLRALGLNDITVSDGTLEVGAMATYTDLIRSAAAAKYADLLVTVATGITGGAQIRNLGTVGGSACYANPSSDIPATLVALDARLRVHGRGTARAVPAAEFYRDAYRTALGPHEILTGILVPAGDCWAGYYKLKLSESSWPIATAAAVVRRDGDAWRGRLVLGGVRATPVLVDLTPLLGSGGGISPEHVETARHLVEEQLDAPWDDELAPAEYRRDVAPTVAARAITALNERLTSR
jgi:aerobic carbon-monoxide dehydrogenase medium subunit